MPTLETAVREALARLGLGALEAESSVWINIRAIDPTARGYAVVSEEDLGELSPLELQGIEALHLRASSYENAPGRLVFSSTTGQQAVCDPLSEADRQAVKPPLPGFAVIDTLLLELGVVIRVQEGALLLRAPDRESRVAAHVLTRPTHGSPLAWARDDPWLLDQVRQRLDPAHDDPYAAAVSAGLCLRLMAHPHPGELARRLLAGETPEALEAPRTWARGLAPVQRDAIERQALAVVDDLIEEVDELARFPLPDERIWCARLQHALQRRDELEGVLLLPPRGDRLEVAVAGLDRMAANAIGSLPEIELHDEHLWRARCVEPEAWWVEPARPPR